MIDRVNFDWAAAVLNLSESDASTLPDLVAAAGLNPANGEIAFLDLSGLDLRGQDLSGWDLSHAKFTKTKVAGANLIGATLNLISVAEAEDWASALLGNDQRKAISLTARLKASITTLNLSKECIRAMMDAGIVTIAEALQSREARLIRLPGFGRRCLLILRRELEDFRGLQADFKYMRRIVQERYILGLGRENIIGLLEEALSELETERVALANKLVKIKNIIQSEQSTAFAETVCGLSLSNIVLIYRLANGKLREDESYIIDLFDSVLKSEASREHTFYPKDASDSKRVFRADAYYHNVGIAIEIGSGRIELLHKQIEWLRQIGIKPILITKAYFNCGDDGQIIRDRLSDEKIVASVLKDNSISFS